MVYDEEDRWKYFDLLSMHSVYYFKSKIFKYWDFWENCDDNKIYMPIAVIYWIHIFFFILFSLIGYYKMLNIVPCIIWEVLIVYVFYI